MNSFDIGPPIDWQKIEMDRVRDWTPGTRLIFIRDGGTLSLKKGYVYTFANWYVPTDTDRQGVWVQFSEIHEEGNHLHNASANDLEIYDPAKHLDAILVDQELLARERLQFIETYGG